MVVTLAAVAILALAPSARALEGSILVAGALLLLVLVGRARALDRPRGPSAYEEALRRRPRAPVRFGELAAVERAVALGSSNVFDLHFRLRPLLRDVATHRLARHGLELDGGSPAVPAALGEELWELVRPDRPAPRDRSAPGIGLPRLEAALHALEAV